MTSWVPSLRHPKKGGTPGLGLLSHLKVIPHFDMFTKRMPDVAARFLLPFDEDATVLGIDEDTAIVGGPEDWTVHGLQSAWILPVSYTHLYSSRSIQRYATRCDERNCLARRQSGHQLAP